MNQEEISIFIFIFITFILFLNIIKLIINFFSNQKVYKKVAEIREEVNTKVRPHLNSLEKKFQEDEKEDNFGKYVFRIFKDKLEEKNEKILEKEICRCCKEYEKADCKEDYCLEASGVSCKK